MVKRYEAAELPMMVMDVSWRLGTDLKIAGLFELYEAALREERQDAAALGARLRREAASRAGHATKDSAFQPGGAMIESSFGEYVGDKYDFQMLTLDT